DPVGLWDHAVRCLEGAAHVRACRGRKGGLRNGHDRVGPQGNRPDSQGVPVGLAPIRWRARRRAAEETAWRRPRRPNTSEPTPANRGGDGYMTTRTNDTARVRM